MENKIESQNKRIKKFLEEGGYITQMYAMREFGCFRLASRIFDLRNDYGMDIKSEMVESNGKRFAMYCLNKPE